MRSNAACGLARLAAGLLLLGLGGCSSTDPTAGLTPPGEMGAGRLPAMNGPGPGTGGIAAAPLSEGRAGAASSLGAVQFLPVVGAPAATVAALSQALSREAQRAGLAIAPADAPATPLRLKGYLSALDDGGGTVVIYVWDVVDPAGNRVSRIQGQERVAGSPSASDPWAGVGPETLGRVAAKTIGELGRRAAAG